LIKVGKQQPQKQKAEEEVNSKRFPKDKQDKQHKKTSTKNQSTMQ